MKVMGIFGAADIMEMVEDSATSSVRRIFHGDCAAGCRCRELSRLCSVLLSRANCPGSISCKCRVLQLAVGKQQLQAKI
jgi:hypothetical protein